MNVCVLRRLHVGVLTSVALLGGCSGSSPAGAPQTGAAPASQVPSIALPRMQRVLDAVKPQRATASPAAVKANSFMYTAQLYGNDSSVYVRTGNSLTWFENLHTGLSAPQGTMATPNGWWYVANGGHSNVVFYRSTGHGPDGPLGSLDDYGQYPVNVSLAPDRRVVAASNGHTTSGGPGSVSVYLNRQAEPSRNLTYGSDPLLGEGVALDHQGNCWWSFYDPYTQNGSIVEFVGCSEPGTLVISSIPYPGGIVFDQRDDLYYLNQQTAGNQFSGLYQCKGKSACKIFALKDQGDPVNVNFDHKQKGLWVADATGSIWMVNPKNKQTTQYPAEGGPTDPPFGIAPEPGG
jgi:hypothetical protein